MIKYNYSDKYIKKTYLTINRLIKNNLKNFNASNLYKISKSREFFLSSAILIVLFLTYLLMPNIYDKDEISKNLNDQLQKKLNLKFNLSQNFKYNFLPRPHFSFQNSSILKDQKEISKIKDLKIYISLDSLFSNENFDVRSLIIKESNFNLDDQSSNFFLKLLDGNFKNSKLIIKDSNIFYKNNDDEVLFLNKILNMEYFYDNKNLYNKVVSKNEIFNLPYSIELNKNNIKKKYFFKLNFNFLKLKINNELDFSKEDRIGLMKITLNKDKYNTKYKINKEGLIFNLFDDFENSDLSYDGELDFNPFYLNVEGTLKKINPLHLINSNAIFLQLLKTEILNNKNLNIDLNVYGDKFQNLSNFIKIYLNLKIQEGLIDTDNTRFSWKNSVDFSLDDTLIYVKDGELIIDGKININIKNSDEIYKFLLTPKVDRNELTNIKANFVYNFDQKIANMNNILINDKKYNDVNKTLKSLIFKKNKLQNRLYLKSIFNRALKFYDG